MMLLAICRQSFAWLFLVILGHGLEQGQITWLIFSLVCLICTLVRIERILLFGLPQSLEFITLVLLGIALEHMVH